MGNEFRELFYCSCNVFYLKLIMFFVLKTLECFFNGFFFWGENSEGLVIV
jgi:hypothetical protein